MADDQEGGERAGGTHRDYVIRKTVPVFVFESQTRKRPTYSGSATPLKLDGRFFLLTAGHVVRDIRDLGVVGIGRPLSIGARQETGLRTLKLAFPTSGVVGIDDELDAGVLETVPANEEAALELEAAAIRGHQLFFASPDPQFWDNAGLTLVGYPAVLDGPSKAEHVLAFPGQVAGTSGVPPVPPQYQSESDGGFYVVHFDGQQEMRNLVDDERIDASTMVLEGASGGGVWVEIEGRSEGPFLVATISCQEPPKGEPAQTSDRWLFCSPVVEHMLLLKRLGDRGVRSAVDGLLKPPRAP